MTRNVFHYIKVTLVILVGVAFLLSFIQIHTALFFLTSHLQENCRLTFFKPITIAIAFASIQLIILPTLLDSPCSYSKLGTSSPVPHETKLSIFIYPDLKSRSRFVPPASEHYALSIFSLYCSVTICRATPTAMLITLL